MSVYADWVAFGEGCDAGQPWRYQGSHVIPHWDDPCGGFLSVGFVFDYVSRDLPNRAERGPYDWVRVTIDDAPGQDSRPITIVIDRGQATLLRDTLTRWLNRARSSS